MVLVVVSWLLELLLTLHSDSIYSISYSDVSEWMWVCVSVYTCVASLRRVCECCVHCILWYFEMNTKNETEFFKSSKRCVGVNVRCTCVCLYDSVCVCVCVYCTCFASSLLYFCCCLFSSFLEQSWRASHSEDLHRERKTVCIQFVYHFQPYRCIITWLYVHEPTVSSSHTLISY